jgi:hypothetical protein
MSQIDSQKADGVPTRRHFLSQAAGVGAGATVLALATIPPASALAVPVSPLDPVFGLIEAHRTAQAALLVALAEQNRLERIGDPTAYLVSDAEAEAQINAFVELIETAPPTLAGLQAWAAYLGEIMNAEEWMFDEAGPRLVATLVDALGNLAVPS